MSFKAPPQLIKNKNSFLQALFLKIQVLCQPSYHPVYLQFVIGVVLFIVISFFLSQNSLSRFENYFFDTYCKLSPQIYTSPAIVIVEIAEDSTQLMGKFPWPRKYNAALIEILKQWNAKIIFFDIMFSFPGIKPEEDAQLAKAIKEHGRVYLPVYQDRLNPPSHWHHSNLNIEQFSHGQGHIHIQPESDGIVRRVSAVLTDKKSVSYPHIALQLAADYLGKKSRPEDLVPRQALAKDGTFYVNWAGKWNETFSHYSYADVFKSYIAIQKKQKPIIDLEVLRDKIILVGFTGSTGSDVKTTPLESAYPGIGIIANTLNMILLNHFILIVPDWVNFLLLGLIAGLAFIFCIPFRPMRSTLWIVLLLMIWALLCFYLRTYNLILLKASYGLAYLILFYAVSAVLSKAIADRDHLKLLELATRDGLTGLYLRRYFLIVLEQAVKNARRLHRPVSLIMIDVDHFKTINDKYGHEAGDMLLKNIAYILNAMTRARRVEAQSDRVARYGGEEFIILALDADVKDAAFNVAERIRIAIEANVVKYRNNQNVSATISLGVAQLRDNEEVGEWIRRADQALYQAKSEGRNCVRIAK